MKTSRQANRRSYPIISILGIAGLVLPFFDFTGADYVRSVLIFAFLYTVLGQSWNLVGGLAKQISLGHAAFFGLGAFVTS
ncbi:MAG TPA: branched-chain amino acid ABC transporter permease, partial [Thermodesulfobacteriota bacterium]|nr:branched-chain amino acid ABC transporter permease [Thermodesulfobacteriota bacterium]